MSQKSKTGNFCSKHLNEEKLSKKIDKTELIKFLKEQTKELNLDEDSDELINAMNDILGKVENKFGFLAIYDLKNLAPKMYGKIEGFVEEYIEQHSEEHKDEILEYDAEIEEEVSAAAAKKSKKGSKKNKKSGSKKSSSSEDDE